MTSLLFLLLAAQTPAPLEGVEVIERLGASVPGALSFKDGEGRAVALSDLLGDRPLLLSIAYYRCPMLCGLVLKDIAQAVAGIDLTPGRDFRLLTISFDPKDGPADASQRQARLLSETRGKASAPDWPFWTGEQASIDALLAALGVKVTRDRESGEYAHPAVFFALTPDGRISRYLYGIDVTPLDVKLAMVEAGEGRTGSAFQKILLRCFMYDPAQRRYSLFISRFMRTGATLILIALVGMLIRFFRRERERVDTGAA